MSSPQAEDEEPRLQRKEPKKHIQFSFKAPEQPEVNVPHVQPQAPRGHIPFERSLSEQLELNRRNIDALVMPIAQRFASQGLQGLYSFINWINSATAQQDVVQFCDLVNEQNRLRHALGLDPVRHANIDYRINPQAAIEAIIQAVKLKLSNANVNYN